MWPNVLTIQRKMSSGRSSALKTLTNLETDGWIDKRVEAQTARDMHDNLIRTTVWRLNAECLLNAGGQAAPVQDMDPSRKRTRPGNGPVSA